MSSNSDSSISNNLQHLLAVGYKQSVIDFIANYCEKEAIDKDVIGYILEDENDSEMMELLQKQFSWNDSQKTDCFLKLRQVMNLDAPPKEEPQIAMNESKDEKPLISFDHIDFNLSDSEFNKYKAIYFEQCPKLLPSNPKERDDAMLRALAIGRKNSIGVLQNIADTYARLRINEHLETEETDLTEAQFGLKYKFFQRMQQKNKSEQAQYLQSALQSFYSRVCSKMRFRSLMRIDDSIPAFFEYVSGIIKLIHHLLIRKDALPPFQIDFWVIPKNVKQGMSFGLDSLNADDFEDDEDEDEDDEDEEDDAFACDDDESVSAEHGMRADAIIGDIEARLQSEELFYDVHDLAMGSEHRFDRELDKKCRDFYLRRKETMQTKGHDNTGAHSTRICIVVDRRQAKNDDESKGSRMYIYSPPNDCNRIDDNHCRELYFNNSKQCILPNEGYKAEMKNANYEDMDDTKHENNENIGMDSAVSGYQFTLSFHVESATDIKCYLFWQGCMTRFYPQDMINLWPHWFSDNKHNKDFINTAAKWQHRLQTLNEMLRDDEFAKWYQTTTGREDLLQRKLK